jgi:hypothetical protein
MGLGCGIIEARSTRLVNICVRPSEGGRGGRGHLRRRSHISRVKTEHQRKNGCGIQYRYSPRSIPSRASQTQPERCILVIWFPRPSSPAGCSDTGNTGYVLHTVRSKSRALRGAPHPSSATLFRNITPTSRPLLLTPPTDRPTDYLVFVRLSDSFFIKSITSTCESSRVSVV